MINQLLGKVFGTKNERVIKALMPNVQAINALEPQMQKLTDDELRAKTDEFRQRIQERLSRVARAPQPDIVEPGAEDGPDLDQQKEFEKQEYKVLQEVLEEILVEAFAVVREAGWRILHMRHFDVQLIGGMVLHQGTISEMKTGEGKTLVATLPVYLNALSGRGVHVVTVNDYLAKRDSEWMGRLYRFLGLTVGVIVHDLDDEERRAVTRGAGCEVQPVRSHRGGARLRCAVPGLGRLPRGSAARRPAVPGGHAGGRKRCARQLEASRPSVGAGLLHGSVRPPGLPPTTRRRKGSRQA